MSGKLLRTKQFSVFVYGRLVVTYILVCVTVLDILTKHTGERVCTQVLCTPNMLNSVVKLRQT